MINEIPKIISEHNKADHKGHSNDEGWSIVPKTVQIIVDDRTGKIEWGVKMEEKELKMVQRILGLKKPNPALWSDIKHLISEGRSITEICTSRRKRKGYSIATIKRVSAALSEANKWKRNILVSKKK